VLPRLRCGVVRDGHGHQRRRRSFTSRVTWALKVVVACVASTCARADGHRWSDPRRDR
jgi:hypothetical protein